MAKGIARYTITSGLAGCYMPDNNSGPVEFRTRHALAEYIRQELEFQEFPAKLFREVKLKRLWGFIARHGSSVAHFSLQHKGREIAFHGLTDAEYREESARED